MGVAQAGAESAAIPAIAKVLRFFMLSLHDHAAWVRHPLSTQVRQLPRPSKDLFATPTVLPRLNSRPGPVIIVKLWNQESSWHCSSRVRVHPAMNERSPKNTECQSSASHKSRIDCARRARPRENGLIRSH